MKRSKRNIKVVASNNEEEKEEMPLMKLPKQITTTKQRMTREFFNVDTIELARKLLGFILTRQNDDGSVIRGRIVETEAYLGYEDKASNTFNGRKSASNAPMYMQPGTMFVYMTYGMYHCFNIVSKGNGAGVLIRAVEPLQGIDLMQQRRMAKKKTNKKPLKVHELCNGPSKLCMSFELTKKNANTLDICTWPGLWIEPNDHHQDSGGPFEIVSCPRIGIDSAGTEWASKPLRFYILGNTSVSKRNKQHEEEFAKESC